MNPESTEAGSRVYCFGPFVLATSSRELTRAGKPIPLIPRYFDLLLFLIERRGGAVSREAIFDRVWDDVVVSDGALSQAIRTLRRCLGDQPKAPRYIRTISRRGYVFIADVVSDTAARQTTNTGHTGRANDHTSKTSSQPQDVASGSPSSQEREVAADDQLELAIANLVASSAKGVIVDEDCLRDAALTIHYLGHQQALDRLRPGIDHTARALLRDTRWELPEQGAVPLWGPGFLKASWELIRLRIRALQEVLPKRWLGSVAGGAIAGIAGGLGGSVVLRFGPESSATNGILLALPLFGSVVGAVGAAGVAMGLCLAEATIRSARGVALAIGGMSGGALAGGLAHLLGRYTIEGLFGRDLSPVAGGFEGAVIGLAASVGYALATPLPDGGLAAPPRSRRFWVAACASLATAAAASALGYSGHYLGAMSLDLMAETFAGSQVSLQPLALIVGEPSPGPATATLISAWEGALFGFGLIWGLTRRPSFKEH